MSINIAKEPNVKKEFLNGVNGTMWKYEQFRAGQIYAKYMFNTREEAESFATQMTKVEPDLFSRIEPVEASAVWN
jgi:hypothetical protein